MRLLLAVLVLLVSVPPAGAAERCYGKPGRHTMVRNDDVRVYRIAAADGETRFMACDRVTGRVMGIGETSLGFGVGEFRLAGTFLAFRRGGGRYGDASLNVVLVDVRAGRRLLDRPYWAYQPRSQLTVRGQHLTSDGAYAYLAGPFHEGSSPDGVDTYEVVANGQVVDVGPDIDPRSFSVSGGVARWRRAGEERSHRFEPPSIRVARPVAEWFTCSGVPRFRASALDNPPGYERRKGPLARALRRVPYRGIGQPRRGWQFLVRSGDDAAVVNRRGSSYGLMTFERRRGRWTWSQSGGCGPRAWRDGLEADAWKVETQPAPDARQVSVLVSENHCASGRDATGRILPPWVHYGEKAITVTFHVRPVEGGALCPGNPDTPFVLELDEPVGGRTLVDGGRPPRR